MSWLDWPFLTRRAVSDLQRDVARVQWALAQIMVRLKELKTVTVVTDQTERGEALVRLWQLRDQLSVTDPDTAAEIHSIYNQLVVTRPDDLCEGPDAG